MDRPSTLFKRNGVLIDEQPERRSDVIDAPKRLVIPHLAASPQSQTLFHQSASEYSINNACSTPSNTETHASKNPTPLSNHTDRNRKRSNSKIIFSNLSLTCFKTVAAPFGFPPLWVSPTLQSGTQRTAASWMPLGHSEPKTTSIEPRSRYLWSHFCNLSFSRIKVCCGLIEDRFFAQRVLQAIPAARVYWL